jgi:hypothetical protein
LLKFSFIFLILSLALSAQAQTAGDLRFDSGTLQYYDGSGWISADNGNTPEACTEAGNIRYNSSKNRLEYCSGSSYRKAMGFDSGNACSQPGAFNWDGTNGYVRVCNGSTSTWWSLQSQAGATSSLVVRYYLNEAASGTVPDQFLDSGPGEPMHLNFVKFSGNMTYTNETTGRGLNSASTGLADGGQWTNVNGTKLRTAIEGNTQGTVEFVGDFTEFNANYTRLFWIDNGSGGGRFAVGGANANGNVRVSFNGDYDDTTYEMDNAGRHVYHVVFNSSLGTAADRLQLYVDGVYQESFAVDVGLNETNTGLDSREFWVGNRSGGSRTFQGSLYYVAYYNTALSPTEIATNAALLISNDDGPNPCSGSSNVGDTCTGGTLFAGSLFNADYLITPSGCTNAAAPLCDSGPDFVTKTYNDGTTNYFDIPGVGNVTAVGDASLEADKSSDASPIIAAISAPAEGGNHAAAQFCEDLIYGGYTDWHLPSKTEMAMIYCNSDSPAHNTSYPNESANCAAFGGRNPILEGFSAANYWTTSEQDGTNAYLQNFSTGEQTAASKDTTAHVRCVRRFNDMTPASIAWSNFTHISSNQSFTDITESISLSLEASDQSGSPNYAYSVNDGDWEVFTTASPGTPTINPNDTLKFMVFGTTGEIGRITVNNSSTGGTTLDTLDGTVDEDAVCTGGGTLGTTCLVNTIQPLPNGYAIAGTGALTVESGGELQSAAEDFLTINMTGDVTVQSGGHIKANLTNLQAANLTIQSGASIDATGLGFAGGQGGGLDGSGPGGGVGKLSHNGANGASYGGLGGHGFLFGDPLSSTYGSLTMPADLGSGGGGGSASVGGDGGGAIRISLTGNLNLTGDLMANGLDGEHDGAGSTGGGGSGGSIWIQTSTMSGSGSISVSGGISSNERGGGGGGGRIAIDISGNTYDFFGTIIRSGGDMQTRLAGSGRPGTLYTVLSNLDALCDSGDWLTGCTMTNSRELGTITLTGAQFTLASGATLTGGREDKITIDATSTLNISGTLRSQEIEVISPNMTVSSTGVLDASGWGHYGGQGTQKERGEGLGGGDGDWQDESSGGGGHAGAGGDASSGRLGGTTYGSSTNPITWGSGSGNAADDEGVSGGGAIKIDGGSNTVNISGTVTVNGEAGFAFDETEGIGGGAGGSIWLIADTLTGNGSFTAQGGNGFDNIDDGGGGGGGYIYLDIATADASTHTHSVTGGTADGTATAGGAGIYTNTSPEDAIFVLDARYASSSGTPYTTGTGCASNQTWFSKVGPVDATLTDFTGCTTNGWDGDGTTTSPYRLKMLNSTSDYVSISDDDVFSFTDGSGNDQAFSIEAWVYIADMASNRTVFAKQDATDNGEWWLYVGGSGFIGAGLNNNGGTFSNRISVNTSAATGAVEDAWNHIVMTYDGSESYTGINVYVNGNAATLSDSSNGTYTGMANTTIPATLGTWNTTQFHSLQDVSIFKVYNSELTGTQVADKCNALSPLFDGHTCP